MPKVAPCLDEDFGTKQCSVIVPEGTEIAISAKSKNRKNAEKSWTGSRKSVICVPIATSTEHCLVPKVASDETFGPKQCLVLVAIGTEIAISAKSQNCNNSLKSNYIGLGKVNEAYDTNFSHKI